MSEWFQDFRGSQLELSHPLGWMLALPNGARASTPYLSFPASLPGKWAGGPWSRKSYWKSRANNGLFCYSNCCDMQMLCCCFFFKVTYWLLTFLSYLFFVSSLHAKFYLMPTPGSSWERAQPQGQCCLSPFQGPPWFTGPNLAPSFHFRHYFAITTTPKENRCWPGGQEKLTESTEAVNKQPSSRRLMRGSQSPSRWSLRVGDGPKLWVGRGQESPTLSCSAPLCSLGNPDGAS